IRDQRPSPYAASDVVSSALARRSLGTGGSPVLHPQPLRVALLTGGGDKPYALGMAAALTSEGISVDFIGSDDLGVPELLTNPRKRDSNDSSLIRLSLRLQYNFCHHIFVHTERMRSELVSDFRIPKSKVSVIPFGINNTVPNTALSTEEAKQQTGVNSGDKALLFFGNIAPYKGLEYLISAFSALLSKDRSYRLIIAGRPKGSEKYSKQIQQAIARSGIRDRIIQRIVYIPDELTELYFKAADVLILPYTHVFQSGVLFLGYSFGLPAIAADVGTLRE